LHRPTDKTLSGGSFLRYTLDAENIPYPKSNLHAIVRKEEHVTKLAEWGVHAVIVPDLKDKDAVKKAIKDLNSLLSNS